MASSKSLDENLGRTHARFLQELGYETDRIHDEGLSGAIDEEVWEKVISEGRFLITLDLDLRGDEEKCRNRLFCLQPLRPQGISATPPAAW